MICLAFDSTAKAASVAVTDGDKLLAVETVDNGLTQSELLLSMAEDMLSQLGLSFDDIDLYAAAVGPGSFTGVRIGTALVKGLAFGKNKPCVAVLTIEAIAENLRGLDGVMIPVMDARRRQVYTALFKGEGDNLKRVSPDSAMSLSDLGELLQGYAGEKIYLAGDGYEVAYSTLTEMGVPLLETPRLLRLENAYSVACVAVRAYEEGKYVSDLECNPTYLRMPQAERERLERIEKENTEGAK